MEITYQGGASFLIKGDRTVAINPPRAGARGDVVLRSRRHGKGSAIVDGPGEYEIGGVLVVSFAHGPRDSQVLTHGVEVDGVNMLFSDQHIEPLEQQIAAAVGAVDILLVRADDLRAAQTLVQDVRPRVVIPFGEKAAELCAALGVKDAPHSARFAWNGVSAVPKAVWLKAIPLTRTRAA